MRATRPRTVHQPDPFAYCRRRGIVVQRARAPRQFITGIFLGEVFVVLREGMTPAQERRALVAALLAHPVMPRLVSRT